MAKTKDENVKNSGIRFEIKNMKKILIALSIIAICVLSGYLIHMVGLRNVNLSFTQMEFEYGCEDVDFNDYLKLKDRYKGDVTVQASDFDEKKVGEQGITFRIHRKKYNLECFKKTYLFIVTDTQMPEIKLNNEKYIVEYGSNYNGKANVKSARDVVDGELEFTVEGEVNTKKLGTYAQKVITKDFNNNEATKEFIVEVQDTQKPEIKFKKDSVTIALGSKAYDPKTNISSVADPVDGDLEYAVTGTVDTKKLGTYTIKVSATDINGNESVKEFKVYVKKPAEAIEYPIKYQDGTAKITIYREWYQNAWVYAAHLQFSDYDRLKTAVANGRYGSKETTSHAAKRLGAIFAVNGDYSSPNLNYPVARNGKVYNNKPCTVPAIYNGNNGKLLNAYLNGGVSGIVGVDLQTLVNQGKVTDTFCFGPPMLINGAITVGNAGGRAQRTFIGTNGKAGDIWVVVSEGRNKDGKSAGLTYKQCAQYLKNKGCKFGIPLDGGGSSTMYFKGVVLNSARNNQRAVVDFLYFK